MTLQRTVLSPSSERDCRDEKPLPGLTGRSRAGSAVLSALSSSRLFGNFPRSPALFCKSCKYLPRSLASWQLGCLDVPQPEPALAAKFLRKPPLREVALELRIDLGFAPRPAAAGNHRVGDDIPT